MLGTSYFFKYSAPTKYRPLGEAVFPASVLSLASRISLTLLGGIFFNPVSKSVPVIILTIFNKKAFALISINNKSPFFLIFIERIFLFALFDWQEEDRKEEKSFSPIR